MPTYCSSTHHREPDAPLMQHQIRETKGTAQRIRQPHTTHAEPLTPNPCPAPGIVSYSPELLKHGRLQCAQVCTYPTMRGTAAWFTFDRECNAFYTFYIVAHEWRLQVPEPPQVCTRYRQTRRQHLSYQRPSSVADQPAPTPTKVTTIALPTEPMPLISIPTQGRNSKCHKHSPHMATVGSAECKCPSPTGNLQWANSQRTRGGMIRCRTTRKMLISNITPKHK